MKKNIMVLVLILITCSCFGENNKINSKIYGVNFVNSKYGIIYTEEGNGIINSDGQLLRELKENFNIEYLWGNLFLEEFESKKMIISSDGKILLTVNNEFDLNINKITKNVIVITNNASIIYNEKIEEIEKIDYAKVWTISNTSYILKRSEGTFLYSVSNKKEKKLKYDFDIQDSEGQEEIFIGTIDRKYVLFTKTGELATDKRFESIRVLSKDYIVGIVGGESYIYCVRDKKILKLIDCEDSFFLQIKKDKIQIDNKISNFKKEILFSIDSNQGYFLENRNDNIIYKNEDLIVMLNNDLKTIKKINLNSKGNILYIYTSFDLKELMSFYSEFLFVIKNKNEYRLIKEDGNELKTNKGLYFQNVNGYITNGHTIWEIGGKIIYSDDKAVIQTITSFKDSDYTTVVKNKQIGILDKKGNVKWIGDYTKINNNYDTELRIKNQEEFEG